MAVTLDEEEGGGTDLTFRMHFDSVDERKTLEGSEGVEAANQTLDRLAQYLTNDGAGGAE